MNACAQAPFDVHVVDEQALIHCSDTAQGFHRQKAARRNQVVDLIERVGRRAGKSVKTPATHADERRWILLALIEIARADGPDLVASLLELVEGFGEALDHIACGQAVVIQQEYT